MVKFYTATGDDGYTGVLKGGRVPKNSAIPEAVGMVDEANAALGMARAFCQGEETRQMILNIQKDLYHLMSEVSASPENAERFRKVDAQRVSWLELQIEEISEKVEIPKEFIVPGDSLPSAVLDLARTVVRRAERQIAGLIHAGAVENRELLRYLNRLSALCFVLELLENQLSGHQIPTLARE